MGCDKALLSLPKAGVRAINRRTTEGLTFVEYLTNLFDQMCDEVVIVARDETQAIILSALPHIAQISPHRLHIVVDLILNIGPLMGLYTGLSAIHHSHALVSAVDMPLVQPALVQFLLSLPRDDSLLIPRVHDAPQVLLAMYSRSMLSSIHERLEAGRRDPRSLLDVVPVRYVEEVELRSVDPHLRSFVNVNTMEEYKSL